MLAILIAATVANSGSSAFSVRDDTTNKQFVLRFQNNGHRPMCLSAATWPDENGTLPASSEHIAVSVDGKDYPLLAPFIDRPPNIGAKVGGGQIITAHLDYRSFNIPESVAAQRKVLHFTPRVVSCS